MNLNLKINSGDGPRNSEAGANKVTEENSYTASNKLQGMLGKIASFFSFFSSSESATASKKTNQEKAAEIGVKYGTAFEKQFLKDLSWKSYFFGISDEKFNSVELVYKKTLEDLDRNKLDILSDLEQKIFPQLVKINQQLEKVNQQGGNEEAKRSLLNQKGDLLLGIKEQKATVEALYKKLEQLSEKESPAYNERRLAAHKNHYFAKQELDRLEEGKAEIIEKEMGSNEPIASVTPKRLTTAEDESNKAKGRDDKGGFEYDIHRHLGVNLQQKNTEEDWLEGAMRLTEEGNQSTRESSPRSSSSFHSDVTTQESTGFKLDKETL